MNCVDVILVLFLALATLLGLIRGLIKMVLPAIGLMVGIIIAVRFYDALAHRVFFSHSNTAYIVSFVFIVIIFLIIAVVLAYFLHETLSKIYLGWADRLLGGLLCLFIGILFVGTILALLVKCHLAVRIIDESPVFSFLRDEFPMTLSLLPGDFNWVKHYFVD